MGFLREGRASFGATITKIWRTIEGTLWRGGGNLLGRHYLWDQKILNGTIKSCSSVVNMP